MDHEALRVSPLVEGMTDEELIETASLFEESRSLMGEAVTKEDDFGYSFFIVLDGRVRVEIGDDVVNELGPGDHFGEVALVNGEKRNATVKALETCHLAKIMTWDFPKLMDEHPVLAGRIKASAERYS
jgi:CRP-like cAMP-binding protein